MSKFSDYLASQITPQMTLLEKFNLMIKFLQENNYISVFYSQENYNLQTESYQKEKVNLNGFTLHIGDCIIFSNGYYAFVETIGVNTFTIGNVLYFQGQQGVSVVGATISSGHLILTLSDGENIDAGNLKGISNFSINESQHLIVNYQDGTSQDLGAIFSGNITISGNLTVTGNGQLNGTFNATKITGNEIVETMNGYSFTKSSTDADIRYDSYIYAGVVKNGNKLTLALGLNFTRLQDLTSYKQNKKVGLFTLPVAVSNLLFPSYADVWFGAVMAPIKCLASDTSSNTVALDILVGKTANAIDIDAMGLNDLTVNKQYYLRFEITFLLSENLAD